ncbi:hypothetical protein CCC_03160 [Paramagnetospirillum magnetotacticum MS-1]|uniref:Helicase HerA central domain-containing protein n=2 Tax=Paramagnetospirillum magnetotacticum TaxID=188 RepID=A0A0C2UGA1_PARME|nr:hypothetical protein CCC_03160 [Paramagnetospirillum magnetotacticum MS-1]
MSTTLNSKVAGGPLLGLIGGSANDHVGYVYSMSFNEACVLTNDKWKERVAGIPHNSFLVAAAFDPTNMSNISEFDREVVLLRVLGPAALPSDTDLLKTRIEHNQRRVEGEQFAKDKLDGMDPLTHAELQFGALRCRILGTFYVDDKEMRLGSDLENYFCSTRLRVFKPRGQALETIVNHINPEIRRKSIAEAEAAGFKKTPSPIRIGTVRYTSTARLHRGPTEPLVKVMIQPSDFLGRRTAVLGMTRTGKSNTVKTAVASVHLAALRDDVKVGQIIFDLNGEYANANHQDDGSSIAEVFAQDCVRYRAINTQGFEDLRTNFYLECGDALNLLSRLTKDDAYRNQTDLEQFLDSGLEEPDVTDQSNHKRWEVRKAVFQCILRAAGFKPAPNLTVRFPVNQAVLTAVAAVAGTPSPIPAGKGYVSLPIDAASAWFEAVRQENYNLRRLQKDNGQAITGFTSSSGKPWVNPMLESYLNVLARENQTGTPIRGFRAIVPYIEYHSPIRQADVIVEIIGHLVKGKIVILDLSAGPDQVRTVLSERIARHIFKHSFAELNAGKKPQNMVIYVEEAHNLIGKKDDLTSTWPRIAKEGAKARISFVYATQEPSSIHPNILSNTENWFVTHLNNEDELRALGKFYDFSDFHDSLKSAQDVGFARIKTLSSPFVVPTQIERFTPAELKKEVAAIAAGNSQG